MITQPTTLRMIEVVQESLKLRIAPALSDPEAIVTLATIDAVLTNVLRRQDEAQWMREEAIDIAAVAKGGNYEVLASLIKQLSADLTSQDEGLIYKTASELLARMIETDIENTGILSDATRGLLAKRAEREASIAGKFQTIGKT